MKTILIIIALLNIVRQSTALKCYGCSVSDSAVDMDMTCITKNANQINCNKAYCTTIRQEYLDPKGKLASLSKACEDKPRYVDNVIEDETYRYYYTACQTDLCNSGPGKDGSGGKNYLGDKSTIYCPGTGAASLITSSTLIVFLSLVFGRLILENNH